MISIFSNCSRVRWCVLLVFAKSAECAELGAPGSRCRWFFCSSDRSLARTRGSARVFPPRSSLRTSHDVPKQARKRGADAANGFAAAGASNHGGGATRSLREVPRAWFLKTGSLDRREECRSRAVAPRRAGSPALAPLACRALAGARTRQTLSSPARRRVAPHAPRASGRLASPFSSRSLPHLSIDRRFRATRTRKRNRR